MNIKLEFDPNTQEGKDKFEICFEGMIIAGNITNQKDKRIREREATFLDAFLPISQDCKCGRKIIKDEPARELIPSETPHVIELPGTVFDLMVNRLDDEVPWGMGTKITYKVQSTIKWLRSL